MALATAAATAQSVEISLFGPSDFIFESLIELVCQLTAMVGEAAGLYGLRLLASVQALLLGAEQLLFQEAEFHLQLSQMLVPHYSLRGPARGKPAILVHWVRRGDREIVRRSTPYHDETNSC